MTLIVNNEPIFIQKLYRKLDNKTKIVYSVKLYNKVFFVESKAEIKQIIKKERLNNRNKE